MKKILAFNKQLNKWLKAMLCLFVMSSLSSSVLAYKAPDFTLFDQSGNSITLKDYRGKGLIIHFWGSWCPFCKELQPGLDVLYRKYKKSGLEVLAVSIGESPIADPEKALRALGVSFKTAVNGDKVARIYNVAGTPASYFINRVGEVVWVTNTANAFDPEVEAKIRLILNLDQ